MKILRNVFFRRVALFSLVIWVAAAENQSASTRGIQHRREQSSCLYCKIDVIDVEFTDNKNAESYFQCVTDADEEDDGLGDMSYNIDFPADFLLAHESELLSGMAYIRIPGGQAIRSVNGETDSTVIIPEGTEIQIVEEGMRERRGRNLQAPGVGSMGPRIALVVRVTGGSDEPDQSKDYLAGAVFGVGSQPRSNSMRAQYGRCSINQIDFVPASGSSLITNGVMDITLPYSISGKDVLQIEEDFIEATEIALGLTSLSANFGHVLFCLPPGTNKSGSTSWSGYASRPGWKSVFNSKWCDKLQMLMHEIGHNLGMRHSNDSSNNQYGDGTGVMGGSGSLAINGPLKCFNGNKNWLLGWYTNKQIAIPLGSSWSGRLAAFVDYSAASDSRNEYVLVRVDDMYLQYNMAKSFNAETSEQEDTVTIVRAGDGDDPEEYSRLIAGLERYETFERSGVTFEVCSFETGPADYAELRIYPTGTASSCPPPWQPSDPPLVLINGDCSSSSPCANCEGDCDYDGHCAAGLVCFERSGTTPVPGCQGYGVSGRDYCYSVSTDPPSPTPKPTPYPTLPVTPPPSPAPIPPVTPPPTPPPSNDPQLQYVGECSSSSRCGLCEGDCDWDGACEPGLRCFQRSGLELVPGCTGTGSSGDDYCHIDPGTPTPPPSNAPELNHIGDCSSTSVCGICQGDCDGDSQCGPGLKCMQRDAFEAVPGCSGPGIYGQDYCHQEFAPTPPIQPPTSPPVATPIPSPNLQLQYVGECSSSSRCGLCEGDCDWDSQCGPGLRCFQRSGLEPVPGCTGTGSSGDDYCHIDPGTPTPPPSNAPELNHVGDCSSSSVCSACQGDCDGDSQCGAGLKCMQRSAFEAVPGCSGPGIYGQDYCYSESSTPAPSPSPDPQLQDTGECSESFRCGVCEGDCDWDGQCGPGLRCFQRDGLETVPGCAGTGTFGDDYCYVDPNTPTPPPSSGPNLQHIGDCSSTSVCGICEGDCDGDSQCGPGLTCMQRDAFEAVPGCSGPGIYGQDYCYSDGSTSTPGPTPALEVNPEDDNNLMFVGDCDSNSLCGLCEGDCDGDSQCADGLVCFQRNGFESVPGCQGAGEDGKDYCHFEGPDPWSTNDPALVYSGDCSSDSPCGLCEGDCDGSSQCGPGLECFYRDGYIPVPGCKGLGREGKDYCFAPNTHLTDLGDCSSSSPCGLCEGDCDGDSQCGPGLTCFQRSGYTSVPGCGGLGVEDKDYCYAANR